MTRKSDNPSDSLVENYLSSQADLPPHLWERQLTAACQEHEYNTLQRETDKYLIHLCWNWKWHLEIACKVCCDFGMGKALIQTELK